MADTKISGLTDGGAVQANDVSVVVRAGANRRAIFGSAAASAASAFATAAQGTKADSALQPADVGTAAFAATGDFDAAGTAAAAVASHAAAANPHPGYLTPAEGDAAYEPLGAVAAHASAASPHGSVYCSARNSANQSVPASTDTIITFNTDVSDTKGMHDTSTNTSRVTIATPGVYLCIGGVRYATNTNGVRAVWLQYTRGGVTQRISECSVDGNGAIPDDALVIGTFVAQAGDFIEVGTFQNSGGALNSVTAFNLFPFIQVLYMGPTPA